MIMFNLWRKLSALVALLLVISSIMPAQAAERWYFPESGNGLETFSDYWEMNGGLPVFGYPTTTERNEKPIQSRDGYLTQWFERNRMEVHPENAGTPYEILLGLLGKDALRLQGRDPSLETRESGPKHGCLWFEETGHNVCDQENGVGFKTYWETHGLKITGLDRYAQSLQLFGLPLTEPQEEMNQTGEVFLTQWFERARFEWHPENAGTQYVVLLGLLGNEIRSRQDTAPVNHCDNIIPTQNVTWNTANCVRFGETLDFTFYGLTPNETLVGYITDMNYPAKVGEDQVGQADNEGKITFTINTTNWQGNQLGQGDYKLQLSRAEGTAYRAIFRVLPIAIP